MSKKEIQKQRCLEQLTQHVLTTGLSQTSLRQLAAAAKVSDRMLLYYFKNKSDVMTQTLVSAAGVMAKELNDILREEEKLSVQELMRKGLEITQSEAMQPYMSLSLQIAAKAHQREEPFLSSAKLIISGFILWIEARLETIDPVKRRREAILILALIDGLAVLSAGLNQSEISEFTRSLPELSITD